MLNRLKAIARRVLRPSIHKPSHREPHVVLGSDYGGWPLSVAHTPRGALILSFGVGEDVSFDLAAIERFGANVHAFDPTPRSAAWIERQTFPASFTFHQIGLAGEDGTAEFFAPERLEYVSYSAQPATHSDPKLMVEAPVRRLETILTDLALPCPDVLKLDIEGFEYDALTDILAGELRPGQLLVEFHHRMYGIPTDRTRGQVEAMRAGGYHLFYVSSGGHEYGFIHDRVIVGEPSVGSGQ